MSNFVTLDEAAKKLGVSVDELVEMRSRGEIFGYRDGGSWKFKPEEIERVAGEMLGTDALDEDPAGSSILVSDSELSSGSKHGSTIGSDILSDDSGSDVDSDVQLVPDPSSGSDVRLVASQPEASEESSSKPESTSNDDNDELLLADSDDDDDELSLAAEDGSDLLGSDALSGSDVSAGSDASSSVVGSDLELVGSDLGLAGSDVGSDIPLGSDLNLAADDPSGVISGSGVDLDASASGDLIKGDSDPAIDGLGSDLELADDGDLVLGGGSDLALGTDSGINLMSPGDSGISLEDEPLDLAASGISGLDLAAEGSDAEGSAAGSAIGSGVDFQQDEEFQLSASGGLEADDDSGSQVIELEDSSEFGDAAVAVPAEEGFDAFADVDGGGGLEDTTTDTLAGAAPAGASVSGFPEIPYSLLQVLSLLGILLLMCMSGILVTDVIRNMWAWSGADSSLTSGFTSMVLSAFGQ